LTQNDKFLKFLLENICFFYVKCSTLNSIYGSSRAIKSYQHIRIVIIEILFSAEVVCLTKTKICLGTSAASFSKSAPKPVPVIR